MKTTTLLLALGLLAGCSSPTDDQDAVTPPATEPATGETATAPPEAPTTTPASATGVIEAVDPAAKTVTIAHGPVEALQWPAMTMTFQAPNADLTALEQGDQVSFEFTSTGMDGMITSITRQ